MYKFIGADNKEYGPISAEQLKQWIAEGRANGKSRVMAEGQTEWQELINLPKFAPDLAAKNTGTNPPVIQPPPMPAAAPQPDEALATIVPYKNPQALAAYYCGIFAVIPCVGAILGVIAVMLGVRGLKSAREHPGTKGTVHAWVGIICGGIFGLIWIACLLMAAIGMASRH